MLIRDWSSDVCSSDLQKQWDADVLTRFRELEDALASFSTILRTLVRDTRAKALRLLQNMSSAEMFFTNAWSDRCLAQLLIQTTVPQIGRESCRESVCK